MPNKMEHLVRSRPLRLAFSIGLIAFGTWSVFPYLTSRVGSTAFINAELMRINAPLAGRLSTELPHNGDFIAHPEPVKLIEIRTPDRRYLSDLERQVVIAAGTVSEANLQISEIDRADSALDQRIEAFQKAMISRIEQDMNEAAAEKSGCLVEASQRRDIGTRMEELTKSGTASPIRSAEALALQAVNDTKCEMAAARLQRLQVKSAAAKQGIYIRDGVNDAPYSQQQRDRLLQKRQELVMQALSEKLRSEELEKQIAEEKGRMQQMDHFNLTLPADHVVWSLAASPGASVTEGQTVLDLADCNSRFVTVELPERDFESVRLGGQADVRLIGGSEWRQGAIRQVRGSAARADDRLLAAQTPHAGPGNITVEIAVPQASFAADQNDFCGIGRLAEVRFPRAGFGLWNGIARMFSFHSGTQVAAQTTPTSH